LVVDGDGFQQALVSDVLRGLQIDDVTVTSSGASAVNLLNAATPPFNLLVLDLCMPGVGRFQYHEYSC
jgi:CheY-like chemotaxis protein